MSKRLKLPTDILTDTLIKSRRRCCICFALNKDKGLKQGQIAHLDGNPSNYDPENLAYLCLPHHDQYDSKTSQSKGFTIDEVKKYRTHLYNFVQKNLPSDDTSYENNSPIQLAKIVPNPAAVQESSIEIMNIENLAEHFGLSRKQLEREIVEVSALLERISRAKLTRTHAKLLSLIVENADDASVHRRIIEAEAGYDYLSGEFFDELIVLEHKGFIELSHDNDDSSAFIKFPLGDYEVWEFIKELSNLSNLPLKTLVREPKLELLLQTE